MTFFYKRIFPILFFAPLLIVTLAPVFDGQRELPPLPFFLALAPMVLIFYFIMRKLVLDLVDAAWDDGDALIVRNGATQERIPLIDIKNVSYSALINPPRVTLSLRQPSKFGPEVTFCAPFQLIPFRKSPIVDALIDRIDKARRRG
jgi:hypothetical protein